MPTFSVSSLKNYLSQDKTYSVSAHKNNWDNLTLSEKEAAAIKLADLDAHPTFPRKKLFSWKIFTMTFLGLWLIVVTIIASVALAVDVDVNPDLVAKLKMANTALDRLKLLPKDSDWLFDFTTQAKYTFSPGGVVNANAATFPATVGNGMTMAMLNLGPCSMLPPHLHPRASNYVVAVSGTTATYMIMENGARTVSETLTPGKMTIFPEGSIHTMMNTGCENAQLVSALSSDDSGTTNLANSLFSLPSDIVGAVLGESATQLNATDAIIPAVGTGSNAGPEACLARCHAQGKMIKRTW
ncbi:putative spherulin-1A [Phaeomoniella chlamydospora]|uniref:Putative spherulin-1A n=1 Tax=Phaeomoniella chlamydospora TaxID=158046 RepID=A0A0G2EUB3_PHACM|nr:putative spherulin-1A [Phaeomoniella chlamydospora]